MIVALAVACGFKMQIIPAAISDNSKNLNPTLMCRDYLKPIIFRERTNEELRIGTTISSTCEPACTTHGTQHG